MTMRALAGGRFLSRNEVFGFKKVASDGFRFAARAKLLNGANIELQDNAPGLRIRVAFPAAATLPRQVT